MVESCIVVNVTPFVIQQCLEPLEGPLKCVRPVGTRPMALTLPSNFSICNRSSSKIPRQGSGECYRRKRRADHRDIIGPVRVRQYAKWHRSIYLANPALAQ